MTSENSPDMFSNK